jgi:hypothetical protein
MSLFQIVDGLKMLSEQEVGMADWISLYDPQCAREVAEVLKHHAKRLQEEGWLRKPCELHES